MSPFKLVMSVFLVAYAVVACFGVYTCIATFTAYVADTAFSERGIAERHRLICVAARAGSLERGDGVKLYSDGASESEITSVYHMLIQEFHPNKVSDTVPADIATKQFACITAGYSKLMHRIEIMRCRRQCFAEERSDPYDYSDMDKYYQCVDDCYKT